MKDGSQLFKVIEDAAYEKNFAALQELRKMYPQYRDDQLLMFLLSSGKFAFISHDGFVEYVVHAIHEDDAVQLLAETLVDYPIEDGDEDGYSDAINREKHVIKTMFRISNLGTVPQVVGKA